MSRSATKGPWEFRKDAVNDFFYVRQKGAKKGNGFIVERIVSQSIDSRADAKLIASAPALRDALEQLFLSYKSLADSGDAGNWKIENTEEGKAALAALKLAGQEIQP